MLKDNCTFIQISKSSDGNLACADYLPMIAWPARQSCKSVLPSNIIWNRRPFWMHECDVKLLDNISAHTVRKSKTKWLFGVSHFFFGSNCLGQAFLLTSLSSKSKKKWFYFGIWSMAAKFEGFSQTKEANGLQVLLKMEVLLSNNFEIGMNLSGLYIVCGKIGTVSMCWYSRLQTSTVQWVIFTGC